MVVTEPNMSQPDENVLSSLMLVALSLNRDVNVRGSFDK